VLRAKINTTGVQVTQDLFRLKVWFDKNTISDTNQAYTHLYQAFPGQLRVNTLVTFVRYGY